MEGMNLNEAATLIIVYSNTQKPGFELMYFNAQKQHLGTTKVALDVNQIANGLPLQTIDFNALLKPSIPPQIKSVKILLDSDEIFKSTSAYPKLNMFKLSALYGQELKTLLQEGKEKIKIETQKYKDNLGTIFYTYCTPQKLNNFAIKLARSLNLKLEAVELYAKHLQKSIKKSISGDYIYLYRHEDQITLVVSYGGILSGYSTFDGEKVVDGEIYAYGIKHFYELEKIKLDKAYTNMEGIKCNVIELEELDIKMEY